MDDVITVNTPRTDNRDETLLRLAELAQQPKVAGEYGTPYVVLRGKAVSLEHLLDRPQRIRQTVELHNVADFCAYIKQHDQDATVVFFDAERSAFTACIDWHDGNGPGWVQHRAIYALPHTKEWSTWTKRNEAWMDQTTFAQFVEDNLPDIVEPTGDRLLDMVKTLQAKKSVQFESHIRLDNGAVQFKYAEDIKGTVTKGAVDIPTEFFLGIAPYCGEAPFRLQARLRWRINDQQQLALSYVLVRPHKVLETVSDEIAARIHAEIQRPLWRGVAP